MIEYFQAVIEGLVVDFLVVSAERLVEDCCQKLKMKDFYFASDGFIIVDLQTETVQFVRKDRRVGVEELVMNHLQ